MKNKQSLKFKFLTPQGELLPVVFIAFDNRVCEVMVQKQLLDTHATYVYKLEQGTLYRDIRHVPEYKEPTKKKWWQLW